MNKDYISQSARDAAAADYGDQSYWDYLESHALRLRDYFLDRGDEITADLMLTRSLSESLIGNDGI